MSGIKVGDIDIGDQVVDNEFRIKLLTKILEWILSNNTIKAPSKEDISKITEESVNELVSKYPNSGIKFNEKKK